MQVKIDGPWPPPYERSPRPSAGERPISSGGQRVSRRASVQILDTGLDDPLTPGGLGLRRVTSPGSEASSPLGLPQPTTYAAGRSRSGAQSQGDNSFPTVDALRQVDESTGEAATDSRGAQAGLLVPPEPRMPRGKLLVSGPFRHLCEHMDRTTRDWNEEFQSLWEIECRLPWDIENRRNLERLVADFDALAEGLSMNVLQSDLAHPVQELSSTHADLFHQGSGNNRSFRRRTVKPLKHFTGCYRYGNLLVRRWRNADDGKAVQRSFQALFDVRVPHLAFPLTATHTYFGTVVTVQALVPMATSEGGGNGASNVVYRGDGLADPTLVRPVHHYVVRLLEALNLSPHDRGTQWKQIGLEILEGIDGRYYVTSALGLLPPLFPAQAQPTAYFRMEHMTSYAEPVHYMCGASLERFRDPIDDLCVSLPELFNDRHLEKPGASGLAPMMAAGRSGKRNRQKMLVDMLHDRSINVALLGRVLHHWLASDDDLTDDAEAMEHVTRLLCIEMIARTLKGIVVERMLADEETIDVESANRYLCRVVGSLPASHSGPAMSPIKDRQRGEATIAGTPMRREMQREMEAVVRFDEGLLPLLCDKFQVAEMRDMDAVRKTFETEPIAVTKRLCQLLGLTMHRGAVVAVACIPHAHNFSTALSATRDLEQSRRFLDESRDDDRTEEVMISYILARRANIHCRSGAYDRALGLQRRITSRRLRLGQRNFLYYDSLVDTALVAMRCGEEEAADALLQRVYEGYESIVSKGSTHHNAGGVGGSTHLSRIKIQLQIHWANFKIMQERYREARKRFSDALDMTRRLPTDNIPSSVVLNCLNGLLEVAQKSSAAQDVVSLQPHVSLLVMRMKPSPRGLDTMRLMGSVLLEAGHHHVAAETLRDAMEMCGQVFGQVSEGMAILSNFLAFVYYRWNLQRYGSTCKELLSNCQSILRKVRGLHSAAHLTAMNNLILVLIDLQEFTSASSQLHRLLRTSASTSTKAVSGMSRQHPVYQALLATRERLRSVYRDQAVLVLQQTWRGYLEKLLLQRIVGKHAALIQSIGRGFMSRQRLSGLHGTLGQRSDTASRVFGSASSAPSMATRRRDGLGGNNSGSTRYYHPIRAVSPINSRCMSPALSMRAMTMRREAAASREENPFVFGFSKALLEASYDFHRHQRDWNGEMQAACEVVKATFGEQESVYGYYAKRRDAVANAFRDAAVQYARILEETPSKAQRVGGSTTAFRFENVVMTRWPPDAVTPYVQLEAMRRVHSAGFPGITAPLIDVVAYEGGSTYVAIALISLPRSNVEYLRHEDLRSVLLTRRGYLHEAFLEALIHQITAVEPAPVHPTLGERELPSTTTMLDASMMSASGADRQTMLSSTSEDIGNPRGIEVVRGADDRWYITNALGFFPTCIWRMESFDGVPKGPDTVLPHLPPPRPSTFEQCRECIAHNRPDDAVTLADEWMVRIQKGLHAHLHHPTSGSGTVADGGGGGVGYLSRGKSKQELVLASYLKALVLEGCNRRKEASNAMRTLALSLEDRDVCSVRAAQLWWIAGRSLVNEQEFLDGSAMIGRAVQLVVKLPHHRRGMLQFVLVFLQCQFEAHLRNHDAGNNALPPIEDTTAPIDVMLRWVAVSEAAPAAAVGGNGSQGAMALATDAHRLVAQLGSKYFETRTMWDESIAFAKAASHSTRCLCGASSMEYAQTLERLSQLYHRRSGNGDSNASIACLQEGIDTMSRVAPDSLDLGLMHSRMGAMHLHAFALAPAASHLRQAHAMLSMRLRHDHQEMSTLRRNTRLLEMQLRIRAAVRVQSYMRGWLTRHRAEEALRFADPPAYRQLVATRYDKRQRQLMVAEATGRILLADEEDTRMYAIERQGVVMRERARKQAIRRWMQDSYSSMLSEHCALLWASGAVPQERMLRAGQEQFVADMYVRHYPAYARRGLALAQTNAYRTHCRWLTGLRVDRVVGAEQIGRNALQSKLYGRWLAKCIAWHEQCIRKDLVREATLAKELIGEGFAEGANLLLGYTARIAHAVDALNELQDALKRLPLNVEPTQRGLLEAQEAAERNILEEEGANRLRALQPAAVSEMLPHTCRSDDPLPIAVEAIEGPADDDDAVEGRPCEQRRSIVAPSSIASRSGLDVLMTSGSELHHLMAVPLNVDNDEDASTGSSAKSTKSSWSHVRVPVLSVTSPQNSRAGALSQDNSLIAPKPLAPPTPEEPALMSPDGVKNRGLPDGSIASVVSLPPPLHSPDGPPPLHRASGSNTSFNKSPINQDLALQRGRRTPKQLPFGAGYAFELPQGEPDVALEGSSNSSVSGTVAVLPHPPPPSGVARRRPSLSVDTTQVASPFHPPLMVSYGDSVTRDPAPIPLLDSGKFMCALGTLSASDPLSTFGGVSPLNRSGTTAPPRSVLTGVVDPASMLEHAPSASMRCPPDPLLLSSTNDDAAALGPTNRNDVVQEKENAAPIERGTPDTPPSGAAAAAQPSTLAAQPTEQGDVAPALVSALESPQLRPASVSPRSSAHHSATNSDFRSDSTDDADGRAAPQQSPRKTIAAPTLATFRVINDESRGVLKTVRPVLSASNLAKLSHQGNNAVRGHATKRAHPRPSTRHPHRLRSAGVDDSDDSSSGSGSGWSALPEGSEGPAITPLKTTSQDPPRLLDIPVSVLQGHYLTARQQAHSGDESAFSDALLISVNTSPAMSPHSNSHGNSRQQVIVQSITFEEIVRRREVVLDEAASWEDTLTLHTSTYGELLKMRLMDTSRGAEQQPLPDDGRHRLMDPTLNSELSKSRGGKTSAKKRISSQIGQGVPAPSVPPPSTSRRRVAAAAPHVGAQLVPRRPPTSVAPPQSPSRRQPTRSLKKRSTNPTNPSEHASEASHVVLMRTCSAVVASEAAARRHLGELQLLEWEPLVVWMSARWRRGSSGASAESLLVPTHYTNGTSSATPSPTAVRSTHHHHVRVVEPQMAKTPGPRRSTSVAHRQRGAPRTDIKQPKERSVHDDALPSVETLLRKASNHLLRTGK